jgi:hypothetical protein
MGTSDTILGSADSVRRAAWSAGGMVLLAMGAISVAVAVGGLVFAGGGVIFLPLTLPLLAAGYLVVRALPGARIFGVLVVALYGGFAAYVAIYPLGGLTPPPGQADSRHIDMGSALVACVLLAAAVLISLGHGRPRASGR